MPYGDNGEDFFDSHKQVPLSTKKFLVRRDLQLKRMWCGIEPEWCPG
jgi:hypothetical protein